MADILKVTTPLSGYDNSTIKNNPQAGQGIHIQNPVDPSKVTRGITGLIPGETGNNSWHSSTGRILGHF
uniref:hypothetical protein n=1 Tax=Clostridium sp. NkU-1 TaxID=1095009 RepID=UPI0006D11EFC